MSQSDAQMVGHRSMGLPRGWVILIFGAAAWIILIGMATMMVAAFQMILASIS